MNSVFCIVNYEAYFLTGFLCQFLKNFVSKLFTQCNRYTSKKLLNTMFQHYHKREKKGKKNFKPAGKFEFSIVCIF